MRKLPIPQSYEPATSDEPTGLRVIAVEPAGSDAAAFAAVIGIARECQGSFAALAAAGVVSPRLICRWRVRVQSTRQHPCTMVHNEDSTPSRPSR